MVRGIVVGVLIAVVVAMLAGYVGITQGLLIPANADATPSKMEAWAASKSLHATLRREATSSPNPLAASDANFAEGIKLYGSNCAACHGVADGKPSTFAVGLYQHAPQLAKDGVEDDPAGVTYWKIDHGIRLTGMPSFGKSLSDKQIWQVTLLLQHMDKLPAGPKALWNRLKSPVALAPARAVPKE